MDDTDKLNRNFNNFQNKYSTFRNVYLLERKENDTNINKIIDQKVNNIIPILDNLANLLDNHHSNKTIINNFKSRKDKLTFNKTIVARKKPIVREDRLISLEIPIKNKLSSILNSHNSETSWVNNETNYDQGKTTTIRKLSLPIHLSPIKNKNINLNKTNLNTIEYKENEGTKKKSNFLKFHSNFVKKKNIKTEENSIATLPNISMKLTNTIENYIIDSNILENNIKISKKINNSKSSIIKNKTQSLIREIIFQDEMIDKPQPRKKYFTDSFENPLNKTSNNKEEQFLYNEYRVEQFNKIAKMSNNIVYKYGDFIIDKYGYQIEKKKYLFKLSSKLNDSSKKSPGLNKDNNHKKVEKILEISKNKEAWLIERMKGK